MKLLSFLGAAVLDGGEEGRVRLQAVLRARCGHTGTFQRATLSHIDHARL